MVDTIKNAVTPENLDIITKQTEVYVFQDKVYASKGAAQKAKVNVLLNDLYWEDMRSKGERQTGYRDTDIDRYKKESRKNMDKACSLPGFFVLDNLDAVIAILKE